MMLLKEGVVRGRLITLEFVNNKKEWGELWFCLG